MIVAKAPEWNIGVNVKNRVKENSAVPTEKTNRANKPLRFGVEKAGNP
jgi:hypothetical protein